MQSVAGFIRAVGHVAGGAIAVLALADVFGTRAELVGHATVEYVECAIPEAIIAEFFTVFHDAAVDLVNLFESAVFHQDAEDFAAYTTCTVGDDGAVLYSVVLGVFEFPQKIWCRPYGWNERIAESANLGFVGVTSVEKYNLSASLTNQFVNLFGLQMHTAVLDTTLSYDDLVCGVERDQFVADFDAELRKVTIRPVTPFVCDALECDGAVHLALVFS